MLVAVLASSADHLLEFIIKEGSCSVAAGNKRHCILRSRTERQVPMRVLDRMSLHEGLTAGNGRAAGLRTTR